MADGERLRRGCWRVTDDGGPAFTLDDAEGKPRVALASDPAGDVAPGPAVLSGGIPEQGEARLLGSDSSDRFPPPRVELLPMRGGHAWTKHAIRLPHQAVDLCRAPGSHSEAGQQRGALRGVRYAWRPHDLQAKDVRLELHQPVIPGG